MSSVPPPQATWASVVSERPAVARPNRVDAHSQVNMDPVNRPPFQLPQMAQNPLNAELQFNNNLPPMSPMPPMPPMQPMPAMPPIQALPQMPTMPTLPPIPNSNANNAGASAQRNGNQTPGGLPTLNDMNNSELLPMAAQVLECLNMLNQLVLHANEMFLPLMYCIFPQAAFAATAMGQAMNNQTQAPLMPSPLLNNFYNAFCNFYPHLLTPGIGQRPMMPNPNFMMPKQQNCNANLQPPMGEKQCNIPLNTGGINENAMRNNEMFRNVDPMLLRSMNCPMNNFQPMPMAMPNRMGDHMTSENSPNSVRAPMPQMGSMPRNGIIGEPALGFTPPPNNAFEEFLVNNGLQRPNHLNKNLAPSRNVPEHFEFLGPELDEANLMNNAPQNVNIMNNMRPTHELPQTNGNNMDGNSGMGNEANNNGGGGRFGTIGSGRRRQNNNNNINNTNNNNTVNIGDGPGTSTDKSFNDNFNRSVNFPGNADRDTNERSSNGSNNKTVNTDKFKMPEPTGPYMGW